MNAVVFVVVIAMATGWTTHDGDDEDVAMNDEDVDEGMEEVEDAAAKIDAAMAGRRLGLVVLAIIVCLCLYFSVRSVNTT